MDPIREARRLALRLAIESAVAHTFYLDDESRVRRGVVQSAIAKRIGVRTNSRLGSMVMKFLLEQGVQPIMVNGYPMYKGLGFLS